MNLQWKHWGLQLLGVESWGQVLAEKQWDGTHGF